MNKFLCMLLLILTSFVSLAQKPITITDIDLMQNNWAKGIVKIGEMYQEKGDYKNTALTFIEKMYAYDDGGVLFKPTKGSEKQFRVTKKEALSYFVGGDIKEDKGFAINPWSKVRFGEDKRVIINDTFAVAMGNYYFTPVDKDEETKVEYTFGYKRAEDDRIVIFLHHSSIPFKK